MSDVPCVICNKAHDHRSGDHVCVGNLQDEIERLTAETELAHRLIVAINRQATYVGGIRLTDEERNLLETVTTKDKG